MSRQARLGLVVLAGLLTFVGALFLLANRTFLLTDTFTVTAEFNRVGGLQPGATVYYNGISVGRVEGVNLPGAPARPIEVVMRIRQDARHLIREDSRAVIQTDGLVGNVIVAVTDGSADRPVISENGRIQGVDPFDFAQMSERLNTSVTRFDSVSIVLTGIMTDVRSGEGTLGRFLYDDRLYDETVLTTAELRVALSGLTARADALVAVAEQASAGVNDIISQAAYGDGTIGRFLREDSVYTALLAAGNQFSTISNDLRGITDRFETAAGWASVGAFRFAENMEALKHNFLFKPYFEERGYLEMAPFEVRERALEETFQELQEWERRLYRQEQEIERIRVELERRGVTLPPAPVVGTAPAGG
jgi:phospholipid/cholesterol/gamma-HCH transport system substrate-binding protein